MEETERIYENGIEMQVLDHALHPDGGGALTAAGACSALYAPDISPALPAGGWNALRIVADGPHFRFALNGIVTAEFTVGSDDRNRRVAGSKFCDWPHFATHAGPPNAS